MKRGNLQSDRGVERVYVRITVGQPRHSAGSDSDRQEFAFRGERPHGVSCGRADGGAVVRGRSWCGHGAWPVAVLSCRGAGREGGALPPSEALAASLSTGKSTLTLLLTPTPEKLSSLDPPTAPTLVSGFTLH